MLNILFPKKCLGCNEWGIYLCERCRQKIEYVKKDACFYCNRISLFGITHERCKRPNGLDGVLAATYYTSIIQRLIFAVKYEFSFSVMNDVFFALNPLIMAKFQGHRRVYNTSQIQPVPLFKKRERWRGFNQAHVLATCFSEAFTIPVRDVLIRRKDTGSQVKTESRLRRVFNMQHAFIVKRANKESVKGKTIILVDDVVTTGSTVKQAAHILKQAGAERVFVWCLARD